MFCKRSDGKKIKGIYPLFKVVPHIMSERSDAQNLFVLEARCEPLDNYIQKKKAEEDIYFKYMHIVMAAIVRLFALRPELNRFVMNGRIFKRNAIYISFAIKKTLKIGGDETTIKLKFKGTENIYEVKKMIDEAIEKNSLKNTNNTDKFAKLISRVPNVIMKLVIGFLKWLDKHGMLPKKIIELSPFHTSCFLTNLKSIHLDYIYHHLYNFGTTGMFISMGKEKYAPVVDNKELAVGKVMNLGITTDERFCNGFYYANALKLFNRLIKNPSELKKNLNAIEKDID